MFTTLNASTRENWIGTQQSGSIGKQHDEWFHSRHDEFHSLSLVRRFHESTNRPATRGAANRIARHQGVLGCWRELGGRVPGDDRSFRLPGTSLEKVRQLDARMKLPASFQPWRSPSRLCVRATSRRAFEVQAFHREEEKESQRAYFSLQMKISTENVFIGRSFTAFPSASVIYRSKTIGR